ncbi:MAG: hypothetical protein ACOYJO_05945 [Eubacterium sp.]|jgi:hypothetical protein
MVKMNRIRFRRWMKYSVQYFFEKIRGLDFSMVYVGEIQKNPEYYEYKMTDRGDLRRIIGGGAD